MDDVFDALSLTTAEPIFMHRVCLGSYSERHYVGSWKVKIDLQSVSLFRAPWAHGLIRALTSMHHCLIQRLLNSNNRENC
jgi:hypothetical protein